jgi:hypothetical protein
VERISAVLLLELDAERPFWPSGLQTFSRSDAIWSARPRAEICAHAVSRDATVYGHAYRLLRSFQFCIKLCITHRQPLKRCVRVCLLSFVYISVQQHSTVHLLTLALTSSSILSSSLSFLRSSLRTFRDACKSFSVKYATQSRASMPLVPQLLRRDVL